LENISNKCNLVAYFSLNKRIILLKDSFQFITTIFFLYFPLKFNRNILITKEQPMKHNINFLLVLKDSLKQVIG
ncbi:hypothetical protein P5795_30015, partial [Bacillus cereus]|nr:hypothetical protein [Bacillus cereus]